MLLDVRTDRHFQRYLDHMEQRLHVALFPVITAGIRIQVTRNHVQAETYMRRRGAPVLLKHYRQVYGDQYRSIDDTLRQEKANGASLSNFMRAQVDWMAVEAGAKITDISASLRADIAKLMLDMVRAGKSTNRIQSELRKLAPSLSRGRAARIARTETHNAAMAAQDAILKYRKVPVATKTWVTAQDDKVRPSHQAVSGVTVPFNEPFSVGGSQMMRPGDQSLGAGAEEVVNCRCALLYHRGDGRAPTAAPPEPERAPAQNLETQRAAAAAEAEGYVLSRGRATGREQLRWIDYSTGQLMTDSNEGSRDRVSFTAALKAAMEDATRQIEVHHNHPSDSSLSPQDLDVLATHPGLARLFAHGHAGSHYLATDAQPGVGTVLKRLLDTTPSWLLRLPNMTAIRVRSHAGVTALDRAGWVKYEATLAPDLARTIADNQMAFDQMVQDMAKAAGTRKAATARNIAPAFIDEPDPIYDTVATWRKFRADMEELRRSGMAHIGPFIRRADRVIARRQREAE